MQTIWRENTTGDFYHDECFDDGESRDGFVVVSPKAVEEDDECSSCGGPILDGREGEGDGDEGDLEDEDC